MKPQDKRIHVALFLSGIVMMLLCLVLESQIKDAGTVAAYIVLALSIYLYLVRVRIIDKERNELKEGLTLQQLAVYEVLQVEAVLGLFAFEAGVAVTAVLAKAHS